MARANQKGRRKSGPPFVQLFRYVMQCAAWQSLLPSDRCALLVALQAYNGTNNGHLALGARAVAEGANINKETASICLRRLVERGFLEVTQQGAYNQNARKATEYRLTMYRCDRTHQPPAKSFLRWAPQNSEARTDSVPRKSGSSVLETSETPAQVRVFRTIDGGLANA